MQIAPSIAGHEATSISVQYPRKGDLSSRNGRPEKKLRRRMHSYEDGRALELIGHAIEYLADEHTLECRFRDQADQSKSGPVQAIELLMARSREIYLAGPVVPTLAEKFRL